MMRISFFILHFIFFAFNIAEGQDTYWHGKEREMRYHPEGQDIVMQKGNRRFNRALYGGNTAFRAEAGDLPEFAMYLPGMGGNMKFGIVSGNQSKWLIKSDSIKAIYRAGSMLYEIGDPLLGTGKIQIHAIATYDREALLIKITGVDLPSNIQFLVAFGGVTGKKFSRDGDIGADPESSFYLTPAYCVGNEFDIKQNAFQLFYDKKQKSIQGVFPITDNIHVADAAKQSSPNELINSTASSSPVLSSVYQPTSSPLYFLLSPDEHAKEITYEQLPALFGQAEKERSRIASGIRIETPDAYVNAMAAPFAIAADAIWEDPSYMHGAIAWRMRLNGWRGPYVADVMGMHDRARKHFSSYALSQVTEPLTGPVVMDTALNLARHIEKMGTSVFSSGYISRNPGGDKRPHHYDMNLIYIDELLNHFQWTGDKSYLKQMWPVLVRHLEWEKRNFDGDGDGLYDAYAAIWASDALQYSGGGVTHASAYNYRSNLFAAHIAKILGEDGIVYEKEATKIKKAVDAQLWLSEKGWYAEYKDLLGNKLQHTSPAIWTIYHAIDENISDPFQSYQSLRYIDHHIPHIPIHIKNYTDTSLYTISTSNWQPYTWSLNNVALSELLHATLAQWQGGRNEAAFHLWKSSMMESMYFGASPGNVQQLTFYDAMRGELYRDFADAIGMAGRAMVEGLFGIRPAMLDNKLVIHPGFPATWDHASIETSDLNFSYKRDGLTETYFLNHHWNTNTDVVFELPASRDRIASIRLNGKEIKAGIDASSIGRPLLRIRSNASGQYTLVITWKGGPIVSENNVIELNQGDPLSLSFANMKIFEVKDPQQAIRKLSIASNKIQGIAMRAGVVTLFAHVMQGELSWWKPINLLVNEKKIIPVATTIPIGEQRMIDLTSFYNDRVTQIFEHRYASPRPSFPTMQLPLQGIGNWAYNMVKPDIDDQGIRNHSINGAYTLKNGLKFSLSNDTSKNIIFTSMWDLFPDSVSVPLQGNASAAYLLMSGSTNPMQSRIVNGEVKLYYTDGTSEILSLKNPENWWPIEQDYYVDGYAFTTDAPRPIRISLKTGEEITSSYKYSSIKGYSGMGIEGGAATVLHLSVDPKKKLKNIVIKSIANDVVIGLMSLTLVK